MSDHEHEETRSAFADKAVDAGWKCTLCGNSILEEDRDAFFATGKGLCSRCQHKGQSE